MRIVSDAASSTKARGIEEMAAGAVAWVAAVTADRRARRQGALSEGTVSKGQRLYEAWNRGIGNAHALPWSFLESRTKATWDSYGDDPATIGQANEAWARSVLGAGGT